MAQSRCLDLFFLFSWASAYNRDNLVLSFTVNDGVVSGICRGAGGKSTPRLPQMWPGYDSRSRRHMLGSPYVVFWFSTLFLLGFPRLLRFSSLFKYQHLICTELRFKLGKSAFIVARGLIKHNQFIKLSDCYYCCYCFCYCDDENDKEDDYYYWYSVFLFCLLGFFLIVTPNSSELLHVLVCNVISL